MIKDKDEGKQKEREREREIRLVSFNDLPFQPLHPLQNKSPITFPTKF